MFGRKPSGRTLAAAVAVLLALALVVSATVGALGFGRSVADVPEERHYRAIVIFRNDDIQPYYRTNAMRAVDQIFIEEDVPVTQAVIPIADGRPITETGSLCAYLRRQNREHPDVFEFALHGYSHADPIESDGKSEFSGLPAATQREYVRDGTRILTECTGERPRTFVPPFNTYDDATVEALVAENFTALSSIDWFEQRRYGRADPFVARGLHHVPATVGFVSWPGGAFRDPAELHESFDRAYRNRSVYVQMIHYTSFDTARKQERLRSFIEYTKSREGVGFMALGEFAEATAEGRLTRTDAGWRYRPELEPKRSRREPIRTLCSIVGESRCSAVGISAGSLVLPRTGGVHARVTDGKGSS